MLLQVRRGVFEWSEVVKACAGAHAGTFRVIVPPERVKLKPGQKRLVYKYVKPWRLSRRLPRRMPASWARELTKLVGIAAAEVCVCVCVCVRACARAGAGAGGDLLSRVVSLLPRRLPNFS